jgi:hypothetical protein
MNLVGHVILNIGLEYYLMNINVIILIFHCGYIEGQSIQRQVERLMEKMLVIIGEIFL